MNQCLNERGLTRYLIWCAMLRHAERPKRSRRAPNVYRRFILGPSHGQVGRLFYSTSEPTDGLVNSKSVVLKIPKRSEHKAQTWQSPVISGCPRVIGLAMRIDRTAFPAIVAMCFGHIDSRPPGFEFRNFRVPKKVARWREAGICQSECSS